MGASARAEAFDPVPLVERAVGWLRAAGLEAGDRLLTLLPNTPASFGLGTATTLEGIVQVPVPPDLGPSELREITEDADPVAAVVDPEVDADRGALPERVLRFDAAALETSRPRSPAAGWPRTRPMAYTSGTTGRRKGVYVGVHDADWGRAVVEDELAAFEHRHGERHLVVSPLYHSGPFRFALVTALTGGEIAVLPSFSAAGLRDALRQVRPTSLFCVPTHLHRLLALPDLAAGDLASLRLLAHAGAPCPVPLKERVLELAPEGAVWEFYGSTEGQFTVCPPDLWRHAPGTVGAARPDRELAFGDDPRDGGEPGDEPATVWVRAPWHARWRYWRDPDRTAAAWTDDWFTVGDLGHREDGLLFLDGRPGDLVITGGVNVYPAEVERRLLDHTGIAEAVVYGVPDPDWGERVVAAVVPRQGAEIDPDVLRDRLRKELAAPKVPKEISVVTDLPRTPTGKVRRTNLADDVASG